MLGNFLFKRIDGAIKNWFSIFWDRINKIKELGWFWRYYTGLPRVGRLVIIVPINDNGFLVIQTPSSEYAKIILDTTISEFYRNRNFSISEKEMDEEEIEKNYPDLEARFSF